MQTENAGNVLRTGTSVALSIRLPPAVDAAKTMEALRSVCSSPSPILPPTFKASESPHTKQNKTFI